MTVVSLPTSHRKASSQSVKRRRIKLTNFFGEVPPLELLTPTLSRNSSFSSSNSSLNNKIAM